MLNADGAERALVSEGRPRIARAENGSPFSLDGKTLYYLQIARGSNDVGDVAVVTDRGRAAIGHSRTLLRRLRRSTGRTRLRRHCSPNAGRQAKMSFGPQAILRNVTSMEGTQRPASNRS